MSKLFIETINQYGGKLSNSEKITILNVVSKQINKKMKILEYKYGIKLKIQRLPVDNHDCLPQKINMPGVAIIDGPIKGYIPTYTQTNIVVPTPVVTPYTLPVPLTPFGPVVGVGTLGINPFGYSTTSKLDERFKKANEILSIIKNISEKLSCGVNIGNDDPMSKYIEKIDLEEPATFDDIKNELAKFENSKDEKTK